MSEEEKGNSGEESASGEGKFMFVDGAVYEGEWELRDGKRVRHGMGTYSDGAESYSGQWVADRMEGEGKYTFATGAAYEGAFTVNCFHGSGMYTWSDGATYEGGWRSNRMHGEGVYTDKHGVRWEGIFHNGKFRSGRSYVVLRETE